MGFLPVLIFSGLLVSSGVVGQTAGIPSWLDRPLTAWNEAGDPVPTPPLSDESIKDLIERCKLQPARSTAAGRELESAGWIPFRNFDQELVQEDVEVIGGMRNGDGMCRPMTYNLFVFVGGRFAGALSPDLMTSRLDASSGVVRLSPPTITAEFARYISDDPLCCPSSRVAVRYGIDRTTAGAVVVPLDVRTIRSQFNK